MENRSISFSIILVVYDPWDRFIHPKALPEALAGLDRIEGNFELVLVNNHDPSKCPSTTEFLRKTATKRPRTKLVELTKNIGCSGGFNRGFEASDPDTEAIVCMSCDTLTVDPKALTRIADVFTKYPRIGLAHPVSIYEDGPHCNYSHNWSMAHFQERVKGLDYAQVDENCTEAGPELIEEMVADVTARPCKPIYPVTTLPLTFLAIRRSLYESLGGFDERFVAGYENNDFSLRALQAGYCSSVVNNAFVLHRRILFRQLGQAGVGQELLISTVADGGRYWNEKWGREFIDLFDEARWGPFLGRYVLRPARGLRRAAVKAVRRSTGKS
ncbi:MAG: glycosyltransferase [Armatimonadetes bacterium]|nr:glycosyltransferase [Armatimonadota bacterium]